MKKPKVNEIWMVMGDDCQESKMMLVTSIQEKVQFWESWIDCYTGYILDSVDRIYTHPFVKIPEKQSIQCQQWKTFFIRKIGDWE